MNNSDGLGGGQHTKLRTAVDTNVLLDILLPNEEFVDRSGKALEAAATAGSLVICELVYAELCVAFDSQDQCDEFLTDVGIHTDALGRPASFLASRVWRRYREQGGKRNAFSLTS